MEEEDSSPPPPPASGTRKASERTTPTSEEEKRAEAARAFQNAGGFSNTGVDPTLPPATGDGRAADPPVARASPRTTGAEGGGTRTGRGRGGATAPDLTQRSLAGLFRLAEPDASAPLPAVASANPDAPAAAAARPSGSGAGTRTGRGRGGATAPDPTQRSVAGLFRLAEPDASAPLPAVASANPDAPAAAAAARPSGSGAGTRTGRGRGGGTAPDLTQRSVAGLFRLAEPDASAPLPAVASANPDAPAAAAAARPSGSGAGTRTGRGRGGGTAPDLTQRSVAGLFRLAEPDASAPLPAVASANPDALAAAAARPSGSGAGSRTAAAAATPATAAADTPATADGTASRPAGFGAGAGAGADPAAAAAPAADPDPRYSESESDSESDSDLSYMALHGNEEMQVDCRETQKKIAEVGSVLIFWKDDEFVPGPVTKVDLRKMWPGAETDAGFAARVKFGRVLVNRVIDRGMTKESAKKSAYEAHFGKPNVRGTVVGLIETILAHMPLVVRPRNKPNLRKTTPCEERLLEALVEVAVDEHVAGIWGALTAYAVRKATTCDANGVPGDAFPRNATPSRWNPKPVPNVDHPDSVCANSLKASSFREGFWKEAVGDLFRGAEPHCRPFKKKFLPGLVETTLAYNMEGSDAISTMISSPFPAAVAFSVLGRASPAFAAPKQRKRPTRGAWVAATPEFNNLAALMRVTPVAPPMDASLVVRRLLPSGLDGAAPVSETLPDSCLVFVAPTSEGRRQGNYQIRTPPEGTASTNRDRTLFHLLMSCVASTDAKIVVQIEKSNLRDARANDGPAPAAADAAAAHGYAFPAFDGLGIRAQIVCIFQCAVVAEDVYAAMLDREPELAQRVRALEMVMYARLTRAWARRLLEDPRGYAASNTNKQRPARRRVIMLTLLGLIPASHAKIVGYGAHTYVARALRLGHALARSYGETEEVVACLTEKGHGRVRGCVDAFRSELGETVRTAQVPALDAVTAATVPSSASLGVVVDTTASGAGDVVVDATTASGAGDVVVDATTASGAGDVVVDATTASGAGDVVVDATASDSSTATANPVAWCVSVRASDARQLRDKHSLQGQVVTCLWTLREEALRLRRAGETLSPPTEIFLGIAVGSKMYPRRVDTLYVALKPGGAAFGFFTDFALEWENDAASENGAESAFSLPASVKERLGSKKTRSDVFGEIHRAIISVATETFDAFSEGVVFFGRDVVFVAGGKNMDDDSMDHLPGFGNDVTMRALESIRGVAKRREEQDAVARSSDSARRGDDVVDGDVARVDGDVARVDGDVARVDGDVARVDGDVARVDGDVARVDGDVARVDAVDDVGRRRRRLVDVVMITSHHDRRPSGFVAATTPGERFRVVAVACTASTAVVDVRPELAWNGRFLSVEHPEGARIVEAIATLGAVSTAQFSATISSGDRFYGGPEFDEKLASERLRRSITFARCVKRLAAWRADARADGGGTAIIARRVPDAETKRDAVFVHRRSIRWNQVDSFATQVMRNRRVWGDVVRRDRREGRDAHDALRLLFLDGFKGTTRVPVPADDGLERYAHAATLERGGANHEFPVVEALEEPQGERRYDLGDFAKEMLERLVADGVADGEGVRVADIFLPALSRVCLGGAIDALAELDAEGWRVFSWDLWQAAAVDDEIGRRLLRDDGSIRLDDPWVRGVIEAIALADRLWRWLRGYALPIHA